MKPGLLVIGGGGHCASCLDVIEGEGKYTVAGIVDNAGMTAGPLGYPMIGADADLPGLRSKYELAFIAVGQVGDPAARVRLFRLLKSLGYRLPTIVSPRAYVSAHASVGEGTIIMHDALVNARASVGANCIVNSKALVEHDAVVEDDCHVATAAVVNGGARIRRGSFVGSNAVTRESATSGEGAFIKAGSTFKGQP